MSENSFWMVVLMQAPGTQQWTVPALAGRRWFRGKKPKHSLCHYKKQNLADETVK